MLEDYFTNASKRSQQKFSNVPLPPGKQTLYDYRRGLRETGSVGYRPDSARTSALTVVFLIGTYSTSSECAVAVESPSNCDLLRVMH